MKLSELDPDLRAAFEESVKLQSHYAGILNEYDGGKRMQFENAQEWLDRLETLKESNPFPPHYRQHALWNRARGK